MAATTKPRRRQEMDPQQEDTIRRMMGLQEGVPIDEPVVAAYFAAKRLWDRVNGGPLDDTMLAMVILAGTMKEWFPVAGEPAPAPRTLPVRDERQKVQGAVD